MSELEGDVVKVAKIDHHTAEITVRVIIRDRPHEPDPHNISEDQFLKLCESHKQAMEKYIRLHKALQEMGLRKVRIVSIEDQKE